MEANGVAETSAGTDERDFMIVPVEIGKSAQGRLMDAAINDLQLTEWNQAGHKVIKYPVDLGVLLQSTVMGTYHRRCLAFKSLASIGNGYETERPNEVLGVLPDHDLRAFVHDYNTFANAYFELETNLFGRIRRLHHVRANTLWKKADGSWVQKVVVPEKDRPEFRVIGKKKIVHLSQYSPFSDHYGLPDWLPALLPVMLAFESNDFKRKFYANGSHAGLLILLTGIKGLSKEQREGIETKIKSTQGPGNFKTLFMAFKDPDVKVEVKGVASETPVKDDYPEIQKSTREQVITAHGLPPRLMSIILDTKGGSMQGQLKEELELFNLSYVRPEQRMLEDFLNPLLPAPIVLRDFLPVAAGDGENAAEPAEQEPAEDEPAEDE